MFSRLFAERGILVSLIALIAIPVLFVLVPEIRRTLVLNRILAKRIFVYGPYGECHSQILRGSRLPPQVVDHLPASITETCLVNVSDYHAGREFGDDDIRELEVFPELKALTMTSDSDLTDDGARRLASFPDLTELTLEGGRITSDGIRPLAGLQKLKRLDLVNVQLDDDGLAAVGQMKSLIHLGLAGTAIRGPGLRHLASLSQLESLKLSFRPGTRDPLKSLPPLPSLRSLELGGEVADDDLATLDRYPQVSDLRLHSPKLTDGCVRHLAMLNQLCFVALPETIEPEVRESLEKSHPEIVVWPNNLGFAWLFVE